MTMTENNICATILVACRTRDEDYWAALRALPETLDISNIDKDSFEIKKNKFLKKALKWNNIMALRYIIENKLCKPHTKILFEIIEFIHEEIKKAYQSDVVVGLVNLLIKSLNIAYAKICFSAQPKIISKVLYDTNIHASANIVEAINEIFDIEYYLTECVVICYNNHAPLCLDNITKILGKQKVKKAFKNFLNTINSDMITSCKKLQDTFGNLLTQRADGSRYKDMLPETCKLFNFILDIQNHKLRFILTQQVEKYEYAPIAFLRALACVFVYMLLVFNLLKLL